MNVRAAANNDGGSYQGRKGNDRGDVRPYDAADKDKTGNAQTQSGIDLGHIRVERIAKNRKKRSVRVRRPVDAATETSISAPELLLSLALEYPLQARRALKLFFALDTILIGKIPIQSEIDILHFGVHRVMQALGGICT